MYACCAVWCQMASLQSLTYCMLAILSLFASHRVACASKSEKHLITLTGSQYIKKSLLVEKFNTQALRLVIAFNTTTPSGLLLYATGTSGDYIALELIHGRIRLVANSDGGSRDSSSIEAFHGENYANGRWHQVNVDIGELTSISSYGFSVIDRNTTTVKSNAKDLIYDLDEVVYYGGQPLIKRVNTNSVLMSRRNFEGCLNYISMKEENKVQSLNLSLDYMKSKGNFVTFHGEYTKGCHLETPKYLKSFENVTDTLKVYSHKHDKMFLVEFSYRTYMSSALLMKSMAPKKPSSLVLKVDENRLILTVNLTKDSSLQIIHYDENANDGVWRKVRVEVTSHHMILRIGKIITTYPFKTIHNLAFPNRLTFGGNHGRIPGFIGCMKDIYLGKDLAPVNEVMESDQAHAQCRLKDFCLPNRPCQNNGRCSMTPTKAVCDCKGTGYKGAFCQFKDNSQAYKRSCSEYFAVGFRDNGIYSIKPGHSMPFKVYCDMTSSIAPQTIIRTDIKNNTLVFDGKVRKNNFHYHYVDYAANKQQIFDLIESSKTCRQYFRYDCYHSTLLDSDVKQSNLGVRWYNRHDTLRRYWHGNQSTSINRRTCRCGIEGTCLSSKYACNCDVMDNNFSFDDGYITDKNDLPITKIRISHAKTNQRSRFELGSLSCTGDIDKVGVFVTVHPSANYTTVQNLQTKQTTNGILVDSKLLYSIIIAAVVLICILLFILVLKRRSTFCCYYQGKAHPAIVEIYKDGAINSSNNNKHNFRSSPHSGHHLDDTMVPLSKDISSTVTYSESSMNSVDPNRYYTDDHILDADSISLQSNYSVPKRSILKIKKDISPPHHRSRSDSSSQRCSTTSSGSDTSIGGGTTNNKKSGVMYCKNILDKNKYETSALYDRDNKERIPPLKQKILELSTSGQQLHCGQVYFYHESPSPLKSSSSNDSELNSDTDVSDLSELLPSSTISEILQQQQHNNKSVRFNDGTGAFYKMYNVMSPLAKQTLGNKSEADCLFDDDDSKTFV